VFLGGIVFCAIVIRWPSGGGSRIRTDQPQFMAEVKITAVEAAARAASEGINSDCQIAQIHCFS
jgi:hypothetical protein